MTIRERAPLEVALLDGATEIYAIILAPQERHFPYAEAVQVQDREESAIPAAIDHTEEPADLVLRQVAGELPEKGRRIGHSGLTTAPFRKKAGAPL